MRVKDKFFASCNTMKMLQNLLVITVFATYFLATSGQETSEDVFDARTPYIVYMGEIPRPEHSAKSTMEYHHNLLVEAIGDEQTARESRIHSYGRSFNGFVARLLPHEVQALLEEDNVVSVFPNTVQKLHTTSSWTFLKLPLKMKKRNPRVESNIVVGVLDTGIYIDAPSFNDKGYGPPPPKWKGKCVTGPNFTACNNKVVGARYYHLESDIGDMSPIDEEGHGSHTSSTIAGAPVRGASVYGVAKGTARGGVPLSRIAMYKVCWSNGCSDMDILAAFDDAVADGVDVISISIGGVSRNFMDDPIAIGSFHAMKKGIFVSCSAGNDGPTPGSVENVAPWVMTVAASTIDRRLQTVIKLGNGLKFFGNSLNTFSPKKQMYPLTSGTLATNTSEKIYGNASACDMYTLNRDKVKGKIVFCLGASGQDSTIKELKGAGALMTQDELDDYAYTPIIPGTFMLSRDGVMIERYINKTKNPMAVIYKTRTLKRSAPMLASFSSRGPQHITPNILKPDIAAPGIDILAAYSKIATLSGDLDDKRHNVFNIVSGTSMACPHVAGAAAYVKSFHPDWSPAAIKSALMTTAKAMKVHEDDGLGWGAGHLNPRSAVNPGLIYDINLNDYISHLCKNGYNDSSIGRLVGKKNISCKNFKPALGFDGLNYPCFHINQLPNATNFNAVFRRTVTQVGFGISVYKARIIRPTNGGGALNVKVIPSTLTFTKPHQKRSFKMVVSGGPIVNGKVVEALLEWRDSKHAVASPIAVYKQTY